MTTSCCLGVGSGEEGETGGTSTPASSVLWWLRSGEVTPGHQQHTSVRERDGLQVSVQPGSHGQCQSPRQHQGQDGGVSHIQEYQVSLQSLLQLLNSLQQNYQNYQNYQLSAN